MTENQKLNVWIALNVTKTLRRITDEEYAEVVAWCNEANEDPHPNLSLTQPYRFVGCCPDYTTDPAAAMDVLESCCKKVGSMEQVPIRWDDGQWVIGENPADVGYAADTGTCGESLPEAICRFCKNLYAGKRVAEPANVKLCEGSGQ